MDFNKIDFSASNGKQSCSADRNQTPAHSYQPDLLQPLANSRSRESAADSSASTQNGYSFEQHYAQTFDYTTLSDFPPRGNGIDPRYLPQGGVSNAVADGGLDSVLAEQYILDEDMRQFINLYETTSASCFNTEGAASVTTHGHQLLKPANVSESDWIPYSEPQLSNSGTFVRLIDQDYEEIDPFLALMFASETAPLFLDETLNRIPPPLSSKQSNSGSDTISASTFQHDKTPNYMPGGSEIEEQDTHLRTGGYPILPGFDNLALPSESSTNARSINFNQNIVAPEIENLDHTLAHVPTAFQIPGPHKNPAQVGERAIFQTPVSAIGMADAPRGNTVPKPVAGRKSHKVTQRAIHRFDPRSFSFSNAVNKFSVTPAPRRKPYDADRRREVAKRRDVGACFTCRMWKATCRQIPDAADEEPCERCSARFTEGDLARTQFCFRVNLQDCGLFRLRSPLHARSARDEITWVTTATVTLEINLTTHYPSEPVKIQCRHFKPHENDVVKKYVGTSGGPILVPSYAAVDPDAYKKSLPEMTKKLRGVVLQEKIDNGCSEITLLTFQAALRFAVRNPNSLVSVALDLCVGSKLCATEKSLCGVELLGMQMVHEPGQLLDHLTPVPPKIDNQLDTMVIEWMSELASKLMNAFARKLIAKKRSEWFEIFLTIFLLINNIEYVYGMQKEFLMEWVWNEDTKC